MSGLTAVSHSYENATALFPVLELTWISQSWTEMISQSLHEKGERLQGVIWHWHGDFSLQSLQIKLTKVFCVWKFFVSIKEASGTCFTTICKCLSPELWQPFDSIHEVFFLQRNKHGRIIMIAWLLLLSLSTTSTQDGQENSEYFIVLIEDVVFQLLQWVNALRCACRIFLCAVFPVHITNTRRFRGSCFPHTTDFSEH